MSQEQAEVARQLFDAIAQGDLDRLVDLTDPEVEWQSFFGVLGEDGGVYRGHAGITRYARDLHDAWELVTPEIDETAGTGSVLLIVGRLTYRGRDSGAGGAEPAGWVLKFRAGKVILFRAFRDPERALEGVGATRG